MKKVIMFFAFLFSILDINAYGVDLSHHNKVTDWDSITASFIYVKATEGSTHVDSKCRDFVINANKRNIPVGVYHFMTTSSSAKSQFYHFYKHTKKLKTQLIPVLDIEKMTKGHLVSKKKLQNEVRVFVNLCKKYYGKTPIIYCSQHFYMKYFLGKFNDCMYWCGDVNYPALISHVMHQKCVKKVPGIAGKVDYNVLNGNIKKIKL